jgi:hypothetical protein
MIATGKKAFLRTVSISFEDEKVPEILKGGYSLIRILSYNELNLPTFEKLVKTTALIDLAVSSEDIFKRFNDTTRNEIRRTYSMPELKVENHEEISAQSYILYSNFEFAQGRAPRNKTDLSPCREFDAFYNGEIISCIYVTEARPYLRIRSIFSKRLAVEDRELMKIIGYATRRLMYEICLWGKENGYASLDLASVNFNNPETASITKFKMSFGGKVVNDYTYIYRSRWFSFFERMAFIKVAFKKILGRLRRLR